MQRKDRRRKPCAGDPQPLQQPPKKDRVHPVQQDIDKVIAQRRQAPERVLEPEGRIDEREILGGRIEGEPDAPQSIGGGQQPVLGYINIVIPDVAGMPRRHVCQ
jgi:hypothetical protein